MDKKTFFEIALQKGERVSDGGKSVYLVRNSSVPQRLYKYRPVNEFLFKILSDKAIYHAGKDSFNDPLDGINAYKLDFTLEDINTFFLKLGVNEPDLEKRQRKHRQLVDVFGVKLDRFEEIFKRQFIEGSIADFGISCFTTKNDNFLMWSHYADNHKGVCLEFDFSKEIDLLSSGQLDVTDSYMLCFRKVNYSGAVPVVNIKEIFAERFSPVYHKAKSWEYEDEYRSIRPDVGPYPFHPPCLQGVYVGLSATRETIEQVTQALTQHGYNGVFVKKMVRKSGSYELDSAAIPSNHLK